MHQVASLVPGLPRRRRARRRLPLLARGRWPSCPTRRRASLGAFLDVLRDATPLADAAAPLRRRLRPVPQARALPVLLDRRRHPPPRRGAGRVQAALPRQRLPGRHPRRAARLPAAGAGVRRGRRPGDGAALLQEYRPSLELLRLALVERSAAVRRRGRGGLRDPARRLAGRPARPCMRWPRPDRRRETVGLEPYDPAAAPVRRRCDADERPALGRAALPRCWRSWSAARSGATATTSSAGPPAPRSSTSRGCCGSARRCSTSASCSSSSATSAAWSIPESWTEAVGVSRGAVPLQRAAVRRHRGLLHAGRHRRS